MVWPKGKPAANKGIPHTAETRQKMREVYRKNKHKRSKIQPWKIGNTNIKGYICITNLFENRKIPPGTPIPEGFWRGHSTIMSRIYKKLIKEILGK